MSESKEKHEQVCHRINLYHRTYYRSEKKLEKIKIKLERAKGNVVQSEKECQNLVRALKDTGSDGRKN
jgi:hypothetical protein